MGTTEALESRGLELENEQSRFFHFMSLPQLFLPLLEIVSHQLPTASLGLPDSSSLPRKEGHSSF